MGAKIPHSRLVHDLLVIEILVLFPKQTIVLDLNFNSGEIMDQNQA